MRAEALGFDSVWVNHHILNVGYVRERLGDRPYYDALTTLTWVAARTSRVRRGTTVLVLPYLNPLVLAKTVATLGVGVGTLRELWAEHGRDTAEMRVVARCELDLVEVGSPDPSTPMVGSADQLIDAVAAYAEIGVSDLEL